MTEKATWIVLVLLAGALLPLQAGLNSRMGKALESPEWAVMISFFTGFISVGIYLLATRQSISVQVLKTVPLYTWMAGLFGAVYVMIAVLAFPRLGPALTFGLIVAGQLLSSVTLDHFNVLVQARHAINLYRVIGILLIIGGVIIIRKF